MRERRWFVAAAVGLWLLFVVQALWSPVLLDDWFPLRYWRDHDYGLTALWEHARHDYLHYNPRIGEQFLAAIEGSRALHVIATPLVQLALLPAVFAIAFGRWPQRTVRDLQLLLVIQVLIWLVIPIPGIMYFYRPFATNYLWAFTITLWLVVPYRLAIGPRTWLVPIMFVLGWTAGMCNEHTGPTLIVAIAAFVYVAWRRRELHAWMIAGLVGVCIGYPMLFFAPGQSVRYGGLATHDTPVHLLAERGVTGCFAILFDFVWECRLGLLLVAAALARYALARHPARPARRDVLAASLLAGAAATIVITLFVSPTTTDRVFFASGVLVAAALVICVAHLFGEPLVRRFTVAACIVVFGYHVVRFVETGFVMRRDCDERMALLAAAPAGSVAVVPTYTYALRSRWMPGDDFIYFPWLRDYVGAELYHLAGIDLGRFDRGWATRGLATWTFAAAPPIRREAPSYRELQQLPDHTALALRHGPATALTITATGVFADRRPLQLLAWTPAGEQFVDGRPTDEPSGHFIRVRRETLPAHVVDSYTIGCGAAQRVDPIDDGAAILLAVDERYCRGPFTAVVCERARCWIAGWY